MRLQPAPRMNRWTHLVRHGLLGGSLVAAATTPAAAERCGDYSRDDTTVGFTIGVDLAPKLALTGGLEVRTCISDKTDAFARFELGGGGTRLIAGARARPLEDADYDTGDEELLGVQAGVSIDLAGNWGGQLAASYGYGYAYLAVEALFPLTSKPNVPSFTRTSIVAGLSPWSAAETQVVDGRPISVGGTFVTPDVVAQLGIARTAEDRAVRDHFTRNAQYEYSSVWTFLRLAAELQAVGAPAHLIAAALDAAEDEVRHAELCAQAAGGLSLAPLSMLAAQPRFTRCTSDALAILAHEAWVEGCLNEGAASREAAYAATVAIDNVAMLRAIARDEAGHAALSWAVLAWVRDVNPAIAFAATRTPATHVVVDGHADLALANRGVPSAEIKAQAKSEANADAVKQLRELVS